MVSLPSGTVAFVFTDIEGSTALLRRVGTQRYERLLEEHRVMLREAVARHAGIEVSTDGDGTFIAFSDPAAAVSACVDAQLALTRHVWSDGPVAVRMGVHVGEATVTADSDYVGIGVHQAARVAAAAHGGQILLSPSSADAVQHRLPDLASLGALGAFHVRDFDDPIELVEIRHPDLPTSPPPRVPSAVVHNLRPARTSFVGREDVLDEVAKQVQTVGLLTLVGPGGVGKTRLATEVGLAAAGAFADGVWLVELAGVADAEALTTAVATATGISLASPEPPLHTVTSALGDRRMLLVLDNCEHIVEECAAFVDELLTVCPHVAVLATSREALRLEVEWAVRVEPLGVPEPAVTLFTNRAGQAVQGFAVADDEREILIDICRRLDGMPLALELAAARVGAMTMSGLAAELEASLAGLSRRGGAERHRTLEATVAWSYELLDPEDRELLQRLAVFRGPFTLAVAERVCSDADVPSARIADGLQSLIARSLCEADWGTNPPRFWLLGTIRAFATQALADNRSRDATYMRLHAWACEFLQDYFAGRPVEGPEGVDVEHENLLEALEWAITAPGRADAAADLSWRLVPYWDRIGQWRAAADRLARIPTPDDSSLRASLLADRGRFAWHLGDYDTSTRNLEEAVGIFRELGATDKARTPLTVLGLIAQGRGDLQLAMERFGGVLEGARAAGDRASEAVCLVNLGNLAQRVGNQRLAREHYEAALAIARAMNFADLHMTCVANLGFVAWAEGDYESARKSLDDALQRARDLQDPNNEGRWLSGLGLVAAAQGDYRSAREYLAAAIAISRDLGDRAEVASGLGNLGSVNADAGDPAAARRLHEESLAIRRELGDRDGEARCLANIGAATVALGAPAEGRAALEAALAIAESIGHVGQAAICRAGLAAIAVDQGDVVRAASLVEAALGSGALKAIEAMSVLYLAAEVAPPDDGRRILDATEAWRRDQDAGLSSPDQARVEQLRDRLATPFGDDGKLLTLEEAVALARAVCSSLASTS